MRVDSSLIIPSPRRRFSEPRIPIPIAVSGAEGRRGEALPSKRDVGGGDRVMVNVAVVGAEGRRAKPYPAFEKKTATPAMDRMRTLAGKGAVVNKN